MVNFFWFNIAIFKHFWRLLQVKRCWKQNLVANFQSDVSFHLDFLALITLNGWNCIHMGQKNFANFCYVMVTEKHPSGNRLKKCLWTWSFTDKSKKLKKFWLRSPFCNKCDFHKNSHFGVKIFENQKFFLTEKIAYVYSTLSGWKSLNHNKNVCSRQNSVIKNLVIKK